MLNQPAGVSIRGPEFGRMNLAFPLCLFQSHRPQRRTMRHAHGTLVGHCKRCGTAIKRVDERGSEDEWVRDTHPSANVRLQRPLW